MGQVPLEGGAYLEMCPPRDGSHVEPERDDVSVLDEVVFPFQAIASSGLGLFFRCRRGP